MKNDQNIKETSENKKSKILKLAVLVLILVFYVSVSTYKISLPNADDMARHVMNGNLIVHGNFDILFKNVYSYTQPDYLTINHHWFSGVIYYLLLQVIGWSGLSIFKIIILLLTFILLFKIALKKADFWLVSLLSIPTIIILTERNALRPENFSYLFIAIYLYFLVYLEEHPESKKIYWLIPLQILWVNIHIFFFIGIALVGGYLFEKAIERRKDLLHDKLVRKLAITTFLLAVVCLLNPNGIKGALYPLNIFKSYGVAVSENQKLVDVLRSGPYWNDYSVALYNPVVILFEASLVAAFFYRRKSGKPVLSNNFIFYSIAGIASAIAGFMLVRAVDLFALIFLPAAAYNFNDIFVRGREWLDKESSVISNVFGKICIICFVAALFWLGALVWNNTQNHGIGLAYRSMDSGNFFKENGLKGPIFNDYDSGSYLVYNLFPSEKVFLDNRPEAYSYSFLQDTYFPALENEDVWQSALQKYNFNVIFLYQYDNGSGIRDFYWRRLHDPQWALVYTDIYNIILVRNVPQNQEVIKNFGITAENAEVKLSYMVNSKNLDDRVTAADTFNMLGLTDLATKTFLDVLSIDPGRAKLWMILGEWELSKNDPRSPILAAMFLDKAIALGQNSAEAYRYLGEAYIKLDRPENAKVALEKSLSIDPNNGQDARDLLDSLNKTK